MLFADSSSATLFSSLKHRSLRVLFSVTTSLIFLVRGSVASFTASKTMVFVVSSFRVLFADSSSATLFSSLKHRSLRVLFSVTTSLIFLVRGSVASFTASKTMVFVSGVLSVMILSEQYH